MTSTALGDLLEKTGQPRIGPYQCPHSFGATLICLLCGHSKRAIASGAVLSRKSKYNAVRTIDAAGIKWDSKRERARFGELGLMQTAGLISGLTRQPRFDIVMNGVPCGFYKADFQYVRMADGVRVFEDVKCTATKTAVYRLKKKLVEAQYGIIITEVM